MHCSMLHLPGILPLTTLSTRRSKELAVTALRALSVMMDTLRDSSGCEEGNGEGAVGGDCETPDGVSTWRTFFPGIFGSLFVSCNASYKRCVLPVVNVLLAPPTVPQGDGWMDGWVDRYEPAVLQCSPN